MSASSSVTATTTVTVVADPNVAVSSFPAPMFQIPISAAATQSVDTGDGVDDFAYDAITHKAYVCAAKDAKLTIVAAAADEKLSVVAQAPTEKGARNPVVAKNGTIYLAHSGGANLSDLFVVSPASK